MLSAGFRVALISLGLLGLASVGFASRSTSGRELDQWRQERGEQHPGERRRALCRPEERGAEPREASDLQLSGLHAYQRGVTRAEVPAGPADDAGADAGQAAGGESQPTPTPTSAHPNAGAVAWGGRTWILRVPRRSDQREGAASVPNSGRTALAAIATAARSAGPNELGADAAALSALATRTHDPASLAHRAL